MVHPHLRGAYAALPRQQLIFPGSSPHTWGIPLLGLRMLLPDRFIPTYVGHTHAIHSDAIQSPVHPHLRGAYEFPEFAFEPWNGSSPHTWGIPVLLLWAVGKRRFIPTYVGHTARRRFASSKSRGSSPHTWGIRRLERSFAIPLGSSPHTWGILAGVLHDLIDPRFIPTYVGHTIFSNSKRALAAVHPHIRGAY